MKSEESPYGTLMAISMATGTYYCSIAYLMNIQLIFVPPIHAQACCFFAAERPRSEETRYLWDFC